MIVDDRIFVRWESRWIADQDVIEILPTAIELSDSTASIAAAGTKQLTASVSPDTATIKTVVWSSSDEEKATVSEDGLVTGVAAGEAIITAACASDPSVKATCAVTVS